MARTRWIKGAIKKPGALTAQAKAAGKSIKSFCAPILAKGVKTTAYSRCLMARTLGKLPRPSKAARARGGRKAAITRARRRR